MFFFLYQWLRFAVALAVAMERSLWPKLQRNLASMITRHIMNDNKGSEVQHHNFITTLTMGADMMIRVPQVHVNSNFTVQSLGAKLPSSRWRRQGCSFREVCGKVCHSGSSDLSEIYIEETWGHDTLCTKNDRLVHFFVFVQQAPKDSLRNDGMFKLSQTTVDGSFTGGQRQLRTWRRKHSMGMVEGIVLYKNLSNIFCLMSVSLLMDIYV